MFTRGRIRDCLLIVAVIMTAPFWLSVYLRLCRFETVGQLISLIPGLPGFWIRRAFYYMTLPNAPTDISIGFCSVFLGDKVRIGRESSIGGWCSVNDCVIGSGTLIGSHVDIFSGGHQHGNPDTRLTDKKAGLETSISDEPVRIGDNVWIGNGVTIFAGVGNHSIIGAGSIVVKPIPERCVAVGNPAKVIRQELLV